MPQPAYTARRYIDMFELDRSPKDFLSDRYRLLAQAVVQTELKLSPTQAAAIEKAWNTPEKEIPGLTEFIAGYRKDRDRPNLTKRERTVLNTEAIRGITKLCDDFHQQKLREILEPKQRQCLDELLIQMRGPILIVVDPRLASRLGIGSDQITAIKGVVSETDKQFIPSLKKFGRGFISGYGPNESEQDRDREMKGLIDRLGRLIKNRDERILQLLTEEQAKRWKALQGTPVPILWNPWEFLLEPFDSLRNHIPHDDSQPKSAPMAETVDGPEAADLVGRLRGSLVTDDTGNITALSLPDRKEHIVRLLPRTEEGYGPTIHALSGPDREGRIAYIEDYFFVATEKEKRHLLKAVRIDGKDDTEIFSRPGSAMWATTAAGKGEIGTYVSLAPVGGLVAFISNVIGKQMPRALLNVGQIEMWNVVKKSGDNTHVMALDEPISWFPDGKRFAYTRLVARKELPAQANGLEQFGTYFGLAWDEVPAIYIFDVDSRKSAFLYVGWRPVVSCDGKTVLIGGWGREEFAWRTVNFNTGDSSPLALPGIAGDILAAPAGELFIYWGLPTTGTPVKHTTSNSPLRGPKLMLTIKVADAKAATLQTIVPYIDPRSHASYGPAGRHNESRRCAVVAGRGKCVMKRTDQPENSPARCSFPLPSTPFSFNTAS